MNNSSVPAVILAEGREKALNRKHPWIFSNAIAKVHNTPNRGDTVAVISSKGEWLAWAAYSPASQIRARIWSFQQHEQIDQAFFKQRLERAWQLRLSLFNTEQTNGLRVVAAESDGLPGLRYPQKFCS